MLKKTIVCSLIFFGVIVNQINGQSVVNLSGEDGSFGINSSEYLHNMDILYQINVGSQANIDISITYDTEKNWDYLYVYECDDNYSNLEQALSLSGAGETTYRSKTMNGKLVLTFKSDANTSGDKGYTGFNVDYSLVRETAPPNENVFENTGAASIGSVAGQANMQIVDHASKNLGSLTLIEPDFDNSLMLLKSSSESKLGFSYNKMASNGSLGITAKDNLYFTSKGHVFSTNQSEQAFQIFNNGNIGINKPVNDRGSINIGTRGIPYESFLSVSDSEGNYGISIQDMTGTNHWGGGISSYTIDEHYAFCLLGDNKGSSTGSRGVICFDGRMNGSSAPDNQVVFEYCSGYGNRLAHITGEGSFFVKKNIEATGTIKATEVKVDAGDNVPDFVFEDDYELKNLKELESFIKANKHLPDIPSAKEMEASGINLAEMNKLLLQKIEELTLYVIDQDSQLDRKNNFAEELNATIEMQNAEVKELKEKNRNLVVRMEKIEELLMNGSE